MADPHQQCKITVDATDFRIQELIPFNPKWYSHKFKGLGLRYEVLYVSKQGGLFGLMGHFQPGNGQTGKSHREGLIIIWMIMSAM